MSVARTHSTKAIGGDPGPSSPALRITKIDQPIDGIACDHGRVEPVREDLQPAHVCTRQFFDVLHDDLVSDSVDVMMPYPGVVFNFRPPQGTGAGTTTQPLSELEF